MKKIFDFIRGQQQVAPQPWSGEQTLSQLTALEAGESITPHHRDQLEISLAQQANHLNDTSLDCHRLLLKVQKQTARHELNIPAERTRQWLAQFEEQQLTHLRHHALHPLRQTETTIDVQTLFQLQDIILYYLYQSSQPHLKNQAAQVAEPWFATLWQVSPSRHPLFQSDPFPYIQKTFTYKHWHAMMKRCWHEQVTSQLLHMQPTQPDTFRPRNFFQVLHAFNHRLILSPKLAKGSRCRFRIAYDPIQRNYFAMKIYRLLPDRQRPGKSQPVHMRHLEQIQHLTQQFIPKLQPLSHYICSRNGQPYKCYELLPLFDGDLFKLIQHPDTRAISRELAWEVIRQVGPQLQSMHENHLIHLDIKPENILFHHHGLLQLTDLDLTLHQNVPTQGEPRGSHGYIDFHMPQQNTFLIENDLWSLGATLATILANRMMPYYSHLDIVYPYYQAWHQKTTGQMGTASQDHTPSRAGPSTQDHASTLTHEQAMEHDFSKYFNKIKKKDATLHDIILNRLLHPDPKQRMGLTQIIAMAEHTQQTEQTNARLKSFLQTHGFELSHQMIFHQLRNFALSL